MHANVKFVDAVFKTAVISLVSINLTLPLSQDVKFELIHHHFKFHPDQMKSVGENATNRFHFALTL